MEHPFQANSLHYITICVPPNSQHAVNTLNGIIMVKNTDEKLSLFIKIIATNDLDSVNIINNKPYGIK